MLDKIFLKTVKNETMFVTLQQSPHVTNTKI